ncbi:hypothetical protein O9929_13160 [Vibrio lentus]|nr:hypothetical protein [Vibrio lentus]
MKLVGVDHVGIATDDMFSTDMVIDFATKNAKMYDDGGYMIEAFNKGAIGQWRISEDPAADQEMSFGSVATVTTTLPRSYGGNKMRVFAQVSENIDPGRISKRERCKNA